MSTIRRFSTRSLVLTGAVLSFAAVAAVVAVTAFGGSSSTPPAEPLGQAIHDALSAAPVDGVTAHITLTNNLLGSGLLGTLAAATGSPLLNGGTGQVWLTNDGRFRLDLQSGSDTTQIGSDGKTLTAYDASLNTAFEVALPSHTVATPSTHAVPAVSEIDSALSKLAAVANVSDPSPGTTAGQPSYTVTVSPKANGGLVGSAELAWDAATGVPLHAAIYATGSPTPVVDLTVTDISYGPVASSDVIVTPPAGAKIQALTLPTRASATPAVTPITGLDAVAAGVSFKLAAPDSIDGLARGDVRQVGSGADAGALVTYGEGLGTIVVLERPASGASLGLLDLLPSVTINGSTGHELVTPLGTVVHYTAAGVAYTVAGSVSQADAESAARALTS
jgi:outer membrane lipoprotein-sorting protein